MQKHKVYSVSPHFFELNEHGGISSGTTSCFVGLGMVFWMCSEDPVADKELAPIGQRYRYSVAPAASADLWPNPFSSFFFFSQHGVTLRKTIMGLKIAGVLL